MTAFALLSAAAAAAADDPLRLREVTVQAPPFDAYLPARTVVDRSELIDSHKSELSDELDLTPGINVRNGGRGEPRVDMRGFDQRAILFTLDGVPLYEPYNGVINVDLFPLEMLDRVAITRGASSALYGPNGMAGAIQFRSLPATARPAGAVSTIWRDSDFWDVRASGTASAGALSGVLAGRYLTSPGFPLSGDFDDRPASARRLENGGLRLNSDRDEKSLFASGAWDDGMGGRISGAFLGSTASFGIPPSSTQFLPLLLRVPREDLAHVHLGIDRPLAPDVMLRAAAFYTGYRLEQQQFDAPDFDDAILTSTADSYDAGAIARGTFELLPKDSLAIAGQVRHDEADVSDDVNGPLAAPEFTTASIAFENLWLPLDRVALLVGFSLDLQGGGRNGTAVEPDPQAVVSVDCGAFGTTRAAVARKVRFPTLRELADPRQGNADLAPEKALTYEVGHRLDAGVGTLQVNLFRSDVDDLIDTSDSGDLGVFKNIQTAIQQGVEVAAAAAPLPWLDLTTNYTYLDATARDGGGDFTTLQHRPAHRFNGIAEITLPFDLLVRLEGLYSSDRVDRFGTDITTSGFGILNAQITKRVGRWLSIFAGADNLLDDDHEQRLGTPDPGRWVFVGFRAHN